MNICQDDIQNLSKGGGRGAFGKAILMLGDKREDVIVVSADLMTTMRCSEFAKRYPDRAYDVGIAEQNLVAFATGMAKEGHVVFTAGMASFTPMRCAEQMRSLAGYMKQNVKMVAGYCGLASGTLGNTHSAIEDITITRVMPNVNVVCPSDGLQVVKTILAAADYPGPMYIRLTGESNLPVIYHEDFDFEIGRAITLKEGRDVAIVATGTLVYEALEAAKLLKAKGISMRVIDMHTVKPLDTQVLDTAFEECELIVTLEEHCVYGALGSAVAEYKSQFANVPPQLLIGIPSKFGKVGTYRYQLERYGLIGPQVADAALKKLKQ